MRSLRGTHLSLPILLIIAVASLALGGCGGGSSSSSSSTGAAAGASSSAGGTGAVTIKNFAYSPDPVSVSKGTKVTFSNDDQTNHTATATGKGAFDTGTIAPGKSMTVTLNTPGTF